MNENCNNCIHNYEIAGELSCVNLFSPFCGEELEYCEKCSEYVKKDFMNLPEEE